MARVTGIGGVFFKARDAEALRAWYRTHLGLDVQAWGGVTFGGAESASGGEPVTVWTIFPETSSHFSTPFMINYRVENLAAVLAELRAEGCAVDERVDESEFGRFGRVQDPEGNRVELWEPPGKGLPG
jgi:catechol 2,3-dioxygenase-like lactoylglutathione lyase family enzyme